MVAPELPDRCKVLLSEGRKIAAIAALKDDTGISLADAVQRIEAEFAKYQDDRDAKWVEAGLTEVVLVSIRDGLMLASGGFAPADKSCEIYCRVLGEWIEQGTLRENHIGVFHDFLYGSSWRAGNEDGSRYMPVSTKCHCLSADEKLRKPWSEALSSDTVQYWFCHAKRDGALERVDKAMF